MKNRTFPLFRPPRHRTQEQNVPPLPFVGPPLPCPILPGRGSSRVHYESYALAMPSHLPSCCGSPCRSLHKLRSLARTPSQPRTRAVQPKKRLHGTCLAMATGEIPDRSLFCRCYRSGAQIQWRISFQCVLIGIVSCVPLTSRLFFLHGFYAASTGTKTPWHRTALKKSTSMPFMPKKYSCRTGQEYAAQHYSWPMVIISGPNSSLSFHRWQM